MYLAVFFGLIVSYLVTLKYEKYRKPLYIIFFVILWLMLSLRYGQGSDYFSYNYILKAVPTLKDAILNPRGVHGEMGFKILCSLFRGNFILFIIVLSTFEMFMLNRFIRLYSSNPLLTLMLFYPTIYLSYYFSMMRQGIVLAVFMGILMPCFHQKKWITYYIVTALAMTIHSVSAVLLVLPIVKKIKLKYMLMLLIPALCGGIFISTSFGRSIIASIPLVSYYASDVDISVMGVLERAIMLAGILGLYFLQKESRDDEELEDWIKINVLGMCFYFVFLPYALISARLMVALKLLEIVIYPRLLEKSKTLLKVLAISFLLVMSTAMTCKNLESYTDQGNYHSNVHFYNYPYISIFDQREIWNYRKVPHYFRLIQKL